MKLIENWGLVLKRAWSIRFTLLGAACMGMELLFQLLAEFTDTFAPKFIFGIAAILFNLVGTVSRLITQTKLYDGSEKNDG